MKQEKKLVLPGDYIAGAEEAVPGENTYSEADEVYSSVFGELVLGGQRQADVLPKEVRHITKPIIGTELYCFVRKISATKAFLDCTGAADLARPGSGTVISAVLPVKNIRHEHVREMGDEVRTGDLIKAKVAKIERDSLDVSIFGPDYGVIRAYCTACRHGMVLKEGALICSNCERKEQRKISREYPPGV